MCLNCWCKYAKKWFTVLKQSVISPADFTIVTLFPLATVVHCSQKLRRVSATSYISYSLPRFQADLRFCRIKISLWRCFSFQRIPVSAYPSTNAHGALEIFSCKRVVVPRPPSKIQRRCQTNLIVLESPWESLLPNSKNTRQSSDQNFQPLTS